MKGHVLDGDLKFWSGKGYNVFLANYRVSHKYRKAFIVWKTSSNSIKRMFIRWLDLNFEEDASDYLALKV